MLKLGVAIPPTSRDFDFNDARPMPFSSAPSTPKRFGDFSVSAPSSPSRLAEFYSSFDDFEDSSSVTWVGHHDRPPKGSDGFAFDFRSELEETSLSADDLFDGGKIKPLKPPPGSQYQDKSPLLSPRSPVAHGKRIIRDIFSPKKRKDYSDQVFTENSRRERGRERGPSLTSNNSRRSARSLSPHRVSEYPWEEEERKSKENMKQHSSSAAHNSKTSKSSSRKWRLKDLLLFRSASEGRASDKDKYRLSLFRKHEDNAIAKNSSGFRSSNDQNTGSARRKGQVSAHELHYKTNKAASQDLKKKTYLPYRQGIMGRFAYSPSNHALFNGF